MLVRVEGDLLGAAAPPVGVDAGVLGDLVDPGLERDRPLGLAHAAQGGDEDLLGDVLGAAVVLDHPVHVAGDPALVAGIQRLERPIVALPHAAHQLVIRRAVDPFGSVHDGRVRVPLSLHSHPSLALTESPTHPCPQHGQQTMTFI
jgi:hypothetical protein